MLDSVDLIHDIATGRIHCDLIPFHFTDQCTSDGGVHRNQIGLRVSLILADNAVRHRSVIFDVNQRQ